MLELGTKFAFRTHKDRVGVGHVLAVGNEVNPAHPFFVRWYDDNGKHYEWFNESEFSALEIQR